MFPRKAISSRPSAPVLHFLRIQFLTAILFLFPLLLSAADPLPLPDRIDFKEDAKLPLGITERRLTCSIVSEDANVIVVETSAVPGITSRFSIDKNLILETSRGEPSLRPFAEMKPELSLPPESQDPIFYDEKIDRVFRPFLKKYPKSPHIPAIQEAEKAYVEESQRVIQGEFRAGQRWTQKSNLTPTDLKAIKLIQQTRQDGVSMPLSVFEKLVNEARTCFASELYPVLGKAIDDVSVLRLEKLKKTAITESLKPEEFEDRKKDEIAALIPIDGWNWEDLNKAVALVGEAEAMLKTNPPEKVTAPVALIKQSVSLMPFLLARDRILRQQAAIYGEKGSTEAKAGNQGSSLEWFQAAVLLASQLPPPENQTLSGDIMTLFEKVFSEQADIAAERRKYADAIDWLQNILDFGAGIQNVKYSKDKIKKAITDYGQLLKKQQNQDVIDGLRKALADYQAKNDYDGAKTLLATRWAEVLKLRPTDEEIAIVAHSALSQAGTAFKSLRIITGCQLVKLARDISPKDPEVKTWVFSTMMAGVALFLILLFPIVWVFASGGVIFENIRYRMRLGSLKKKAPKNPTNSIPRRNK